MRPREAAPATSPARRPTSSPSIRSARWSAASWSALWSASWCRGREREEELLGKTGRRLTDAARDAAQRGLDAGKEQIDDIRAKAAQKVGEAVADVVGGKH